MQVGDRHQLPLAGAPLRQVDPRRCLPFAPFDGDGLGVVGMACERAPVPWDCWEATSTIATASGWGVVGAPSSTTGVAAGTIAADIAWGAEKMALTGKK